MKHSFKRVQNDACIGGIGCAVSEFAGGALKGICVLRTLALVAAMVIGAASARADGTVVSGAAHSGYCGKPSENDGKNVVWYVAAEDDPATTDIDETKVLTIMKNPEVTDANADFSMADYENDDATVAGNFAPWIQPDGDGTSSAGINWDIERVVIADGVTSVGKKAFDRCGSLTSVEIGATVTAICEKAFSCCNRLTAITLHEGLETIGNNAFELISKLSAITIPASVKNIGLFAFQSCNGLTVVTMLGSTPPTISSRVFYECGHLKVILVPTEAACTSYYNNWGGNLSDEQKRLLAPSVITLAKNASGWSTYCHQYPLSYSLSDGNTGDAAPKAWAISDFDSATKSVTLEEMIQYIRLGEDPDTGDDITESYWAAKHLVPTLFEYTYDDTYGASNKLTLTADLRTTMSFQEFDAKYHTWELISGTGYVYSNPWSNAIDATEVAAIINPEGYATYMLRSGAFIRIDANEGLFAHRCLLNISTQALGGNPNAARSLTIGTGEATGISEELRVKSEESATADAWYDLQGRRVAAPKKGIYLKNGKKMILK